MGTIGRGDVIMNWRVLAIGIITGMLVSTLLYVPLTGIQARDPYDPWADINDDGYIGIDDIVYVADHFGTAGDPAKPVTIIGYNWSVYLYNITVPAHEGGYLNISTAGYRQITLYFSPRVYVWASSSSSLFSESLNVTVAFLIGSYYGYEDSFNIPAVVVRGGPWEPPAEQYLPGNPAAVVRTYSIKGPVLIVGYYNPTDYQWDSELVIYLTA